MKIKSCTIALLMALTFGLAAADELICEPIKSSGEGHWPIPESAFTKKNAIDKLEKLKSLMDVPAVLIEDLESRKHNTFVIFEGYILKKRIAELEAENSDLVFKAKEAFCKFLENEAYVSH